MRLNIHHKITLILAGTVAVILTGTYFYLNNNLKRHMFSRMEAGLAKDVELAKLYLQASPKAMTDTEHADQTADAIGRSLGMRATIIDARGNVMGDSQLDPEALADEDNHLGRQEIQDAVQQGYGEGRRFSLLHQEDMLYMASRLDPQTKGGFIRLAIPLSEIDAMSDNLKKILFTACLFAFLLTIAIGSSAFMFITRPIKEISNMAKEIAMGHYSKRISLPSNDELGELGQSINYMSAQIHSRIEEVISNKSRFEAVLLSMYEGTMVVDRNGTIILMNDMLKRLFHIDKDPTGCKPIEVIRNIEVQEMIDEVFRSKGVGASREVTVLLQEERIMQVYAAPVLRESIMDGAVFVFHDITELRRLEKVRRDFVANVSHEIRTPLTSIKGYVETLLDGAIDDRDHANDFLKIIGADSDRLVQLVDDLLDLSKIESGNLNLTIGPNSIEEVVDRVMAGLKKQANKRKVTMTKAIPVSLPKVMMDETAVAQVLLNLIDNAIKYTDKGGSVTVSALEKGSMVEISVADEGIGIPQDDLPRIFERFYRVDKARSRQLGGTGLGLSIVKHIIQSHGGEVSVQSVLQQGSVFTFTLPQA